MDGGLLQQHLHTAKANVLAPTSFYPIGQLCGSDAYGDLHYRILHPHLVKRDTRSVTLFGDVLGDSLDHNDGRDARQDH